MSCKNCGSPFHEIWDCKKPPKNRDNPAPPQVAQGSGFETPPHPEAPSKSTATISSAQAPLVDTKLKDTRKTDRHKPGYQARKQKEYRDRKRLGK